MLSAADVRARLDSLAKPRGSLGRLEDLAVRLAVIQDSLQPRTRPRRLVLFAADHGVVGSGVSAWPSTITALMVNTILAKRAASSALAAAHGCDLRLIDVGVAGIVSRNPPSFFANARIAPGTRDLAAHPAMTAEEFDRAWEIGAHEAERAIREGFKLLIAGEMGIGNTTAAACLTTLLVGVDAGVATGRGAGADDAILARKRAIVSSAVERSAPLMEKDPRQGIAAVCGFEIAAMAGFMAAASASGVALLLDGYVATAAALVARQFVPESARHFIASHLSDEPGHLHALEHLGLVPLLEWNMRLGEGTGALVALPLLDSAAALLNDVATLAELGVARED